MTDLMKRPVEPNGFALPVAIFAIVVVGVLVTGGFFVAQQESRIGVASTNSAAAFYMAERGIADVVGDFGASALNSLTVWEDSTVTDSIDDGVVDITITRTGNRTYFLDATSRITEQGRLSGATRRIGLMTKLFAAIIDPPAALTTQGNLKVGGSSQIIGLDSVPEAWDGYCDPTDLTDKPGIMIDDTSAITYSGNNYEVTGDPAADEDPNLNADSLMMFGDMHFDDLADIADLRITSDPGPGPDSVNVLGAWRCRTGQTFWENWGDPKNPGGVCGSYFPIIYAPGNLRLTASTYNAGQGILLVGGDLNLQGGFTFYGPVIVKGTLTTQGTGGHILGGVIAANVNLDASTVLGNAVVQYSTCGVERAILENDNLTRLKPITERAWIDLSSVGN